MKSLILFLLVFSVGVLQAQAAHSVKLNWTTSTSTCVVNTNVHRSATSGGEVIGTNFAVVPDAGHGVPGTYTDTTVNAGETWYYTVSAYGGACGGTTHESVMSTEFKAVIPLDPPAAPTGLTGVVQ